MLLKKKDVKAFVHANGKKIGDDGLDALNREVAKVLNRWCAYNGKILGPWCIEADAQAREVSHASRGRK